MFHSHSGHVLQPFIDQAKQDASKPVLLALAYHLVKFAPNYYTQGGGYYSDGEKEEAFTILKSHGLAGFCNLSPRWKKQTLAKIREAAKEVKA